MIYWLLGVVIAVLVWALLWQRNPKLAFGVLPGLLIAWIAFRLVTYYLSTVEKVPVWLPPIPFATVALLLFVFGAWVWFRGEPPTVRKDEHSEH